MTAEVAPSSVIWVGGVRVDDIIKSQSNVSKRVKERKDAFISIFQELSNNNIAQPVARNFCWEWSKNWIVVALKSVEAATAVRDAFDTWSAPSDTAAVKAVKAQRLERLRELFTPHGIDFSYLIVDFKTPRRAQTQLQGAGSTEVSKGGREDPGPADTNAGSQLDLNMHKRQWSSTVANRPVAVSAAQSHSVAASVGHSRANGDVWNLMGSDGSNINREHRGNETPDSQAHQPTVVSILDHPKHRIAVIKLALPKTQPTLIGVFPLETASGTQPDEETQRKFTQNIVL